MTQANQPARTRSRFLVAPWGLVTAAGFVACCATVLGFLGRFSWFLDLFSHFRVQYAVALGIFGAILAIGHRLRVATAFLAFAFVNSLQVIPLYVGGTRAPNQGRAVFRALQLNVSTDWGNADQVRSLIIKAKPDFIVLEEISFKWMGDLAWLTNAYPLFLTEPREDNFGIGLFSKLPLEKGEVVYIGAAGVPSIIATVVLESTNLQVVATHPLPPAGGEYSRLRNHQLELLPDYLSGTTPLLLLGDLNTTPWNYHFRKLISQTGLRNSAKGFGVQATWPTFLPLLGIPIDHCLHSPSITIVERKVGGSVSSDHYPLVIGFMVPVQSGQPPAKQ
jgi:endonuclease/exonuclease/phosphatase (EEP) superfamily protein YafD